MLHRSLNMNFNSGQTGSSNVVKNNLILVDLKDYYHFASFVGFWLIVPVSMI